MRQVFDYTVRLETSHPVLKLNLLALKEKGETFLSFLAPKGANKPLHHELLVSEKNSVLTLHVFFSVNVELDERLFDNFYDKFCEEDFSLRLEVFIHDDQELDSSRLFANGYWQTVML